MQIKESRSPVIEQSLRKTQATAVKNSPRHANRHELNMRQIKLQPIKTKNRMHNNLLQSGALQNERAVTQTIQQTHNEPLV